MSVDIGKISVTFAASTEGFTRGVGSASKALLDFAAKSREAGESLKGGFAAGFGDTIDALTKRLDEGALSGEAYGAAITSAFGKASRAIDSGAAGSFDVLAKQMEVGIVTGEEFAEALGEVAGRASDAVDSAATESFDSLTKALNEGTMSAEEFADAVVSVAAGEAGAGLENARNSVAALDAALANAAISGDEFVLLQREITANATEDATKRQADALARLSEQFNLGQIEANDFGEKIRTIETSFRIEAIGEYEAQMASLGRAFSTHAISTEQFKDEQERLAAVLRQRIVGQLEDELATLPAAYAAAGRSAEELAEAQEKVNQAIAAGDAAQKRAVAKAKAAASGAGGHGGGHGGGIMEGLEKVGAVTAMVPGEIGHVGHTMENVVHAAEMAQKAIAGLGPEFAALAGPIGMAAAALTVVGGALMHVVSEFGAAAREAMQLSTQFGTTLRETAELQTVLSHVGSSMGEFQRVARTLEQNLTRAAAGTSGASVALRRLGIDAKEVRFDDAATQVREVVIALAKVENPAERSALAMKLLGKQGAQFAAKFGTDIHAIEEQLEHAAQATERFKNAFPEFDAGQLVKAKGDIDSIGHASEGLAGIVASAFAPLMGGVSSGIADLIGAITNVLLPFQGIIQVVGAAIGETFRVIGSAINSTARIFGAGISNIATLFDYLFQTMTGGVGVVEMIQGAASAAIEAFEGFATLSEEIRDNFAAWTTGTTVEELEQARRHAKELAAAGELAASVQEKYGDKTEEIKEKIEAIKNLRQTMGGDGKPLISAEEAAGALEDLNNQLATASPYLRMMNDEGKKFDSAMKSASKAAEDMGNSVASRALAEYRKGYKELLEQRAALGKKLFDAGVEGLADKFNKEMEKAKPIKVLQDQMAELAKAWTKQTGGAGVARDFQDFRMAFLAAGPNANYGQMTNARMQRLDQFGAEMGLQAPKMEGVELFQHRMEELNIVAQEVAKHQGDIASEEKKLADMRKRAIDELISDSERMAGSIGAREIGPAEKAADGLAQLAKALDAAETAMAEAAFSRDDAAFNKASKQVQEIQERKDRATAAIGNQNKREGEGEKAVREFEEAMADIRAARAKLGDTPELKQAEENLKNKFAMDNLDLIDKSIKGGRPSEKAATGIDATSQEGVSTYFRIMRQDGSISKRQLDEAKQMRILLQKIEANGGFAAANI